MSRSYTVTFTFNNNSYMAVIAQVQNAVSVYIPDESLHHIVPEGRFSFDAEQGLNIDPMGLTPLQNLMLNVQTAIELKAQTQRADNV